MSATSTRNFKIQGMGMLSGVFGILLLSVVFCTGQASGAGFGVENNQVTIHTDLLPYTPAVGTDGVVDRVDAMQGTSLSRIAIGLVNDNAPAGTHNVELGIVVDDANDLRRIEAYLSGVSVLVGAGSTSVSIPAGSFVKLVARSGDGATLVSTTLDNDGADGPVTAENNTIVFNLTNLQNRITQQFGAVTSITAQGSYTFSILIKSQVPVGHVTGGVVTPFPSFDIGPNPTQYGKNLAVIPGSPIASATYLNGNSYTIRGHFGVGLNAPPTPGEAPTLNSAPPPPVPPPVQPPTPIGDGEPITTNTTVTGNISNNTIGEEVTVTISNGTMTNPTLGAGSVIDGGGTGVVAGNITGTGTGGIITNAVIDAASITNVEIGPGCLVTQNTVTNIVGLDLTQAVRNAAGILSADAPILVDQTGTERTLSDLMSASVNTLLSDSTCTTRSDSAGTTILSAQNLQGVVVPARITRVETTNRPDGVEMADTGELVIIQNGIATTLAPDSYDSTSFEAALGAGGASTQTNPNGIVLVDLPGGIRVALRFGNFGIAPAAGTASLAQAQAVFSMVGNPSDPENFGLQVTYPDGTTQGLPPFLHDLNGFKGLLDANGIACRFDPANGVFQLMDQTGNTWYRGRPGYFMDPAPARTSGLTVEVAGDVNGDGLVDFFLTTPAGRQIIHTLPLN